MQAASLLDGLSFDGFPPFKYSRSSAEVDVSRRQVVQALVVSTVVVVLDELVDAVFELTWQIVVLQQDPVFHRAVISLDLTLRIRGRPYHPMTYPSHAGADRDPEIDSHDFQRRWLGRLQSNISRPNKQPKLNRSAMRVVICLLFV